MKRKRAKILFSVVFAVLIISCLWAAAQFTGLWKSGKRKPLTPYYQSKLTLDNIPFNGRQAYVYLTQLCEIGPRCTGSEGMKRQQEFITAHFQKYNCTVQRQEFDYPHPQTGVPVRGCNLIVKWNPERTRRVLLCTHYDTLPFPFLDNNNPKGRFVGANDGASGTAILMEMANWVNTKKESETGKTNNTDSADGLGIDFVFLDTEEFLFRRDGRFFVGSEFFASQYAQNPNRGYKYEYGVLLDMVGDADLQLYYERNSISWRNSAPIARGIWNTAKKLKVKEFIPTTKYVINDDHLMLHNIGGIPIVDIIDFDYPYWHTMEDVPENCSAESLAKVGWVMVEWLKTLK